MCGRFNIIDDPLLQTLLTELGIDLRLPTRVNIAPTEAVPVIRQLGHQRGIADMRWWLVPAWARQPSSKFSMFNARAETIAHSKAYARPYRSQRGIIPASSYIEWQTTAGSKTPWLIKPQQHAIAFAAVWDHWQSGNEIIESCAILTVAAPPAMAEVHHRMPLMLPAGAWDAWLDSTTPLAELSPMLAPESNTGYLLHALDRAVGNSRNKSPALLAAVGDTLQLESTNNADNTTTEKGKPRHDPACCSDALETRCK